MPARMWKHSHSAVEDTGVECLGDWGRCRMAIDDDYIMDRELWTGVLQRWCVNSKMSLPESVSAEDGFFKDYCSPISCRYSKGFPRTGHLYNHSTILARRNAFRQLFYSAKYSCVTVPFISVKNSMFALFGPVHATNNQSQYNLPPLDTSLIKADDHHFLDRLNLSTSHLSNFVLMLWRRFQHSQVWVVASLFTCLPCVEGRALQFHHDDKTVDFKQFFHDLWLRFVGEVAGPLVLDILLAIILLLVYAVFVTKRKSSSLPYILVIVELGIFYLGMDQQIHNYLLAILWAFGALLKAEYIKQSLELVRARRFKLITVLGFGIITAMLTAYISAPLEGRYSNFWVFAIVAFLPAMTLSTWLCDVALEGMKEFLRWVIHIINQLTLPSEHEE